jgi:hypothetical protein
MEESEQIGVFIMKTLFGLGLSLFALYIMIFNIDMLYRFIKKKLKK